MAGLQARGRGLVLVGALALLAPGCSLIGDDDGDGTATTSDATGGQSDAGTLIIDVETVPAGAGTFRFTGVPSGAIPSDGTLVVADLEPGTYTTTQVDPAPEYDVTGVRCDDESSGTVSSGDAATRTAVQNLDAGETVRCTFTVARRGSLVVVGRTVPDGVPGSFRFTGVPSGTVATDGTLAVANLTPGTYTTTQVDPAPEFDLTAVECDDESSDLVSSGDAATRSAVQNLDPGETVTCVFTNTRRGTVVATVETESEGDDGDFRFTGVPSGTISAGGTLVAAELSAGTYTSTLADPSPDFEITEAECDDSSSSTASSADVETRSAIYNLDPGETVRCRFTVSRPGGDTDIAGGSKPGGGGGAEGGGDDGGTTGPADPSAINPFEEPDPDFPDFPEPQVPDEPQPGLVPKPGPWTARNFDGIVDCGGMSLPLLGVVPDFGSIEVLDGGATLIGTPTDPAESAVTMTAEPSILGRYTGSLSVSEQGMSVTFDFYWQVVNDEYIVGFLTSEFEGAGLSCSVYRSFDLTYTG